MATPAPADVGFSAAKSSANGSGSTSSTSALTVLTLDRPCDDLHLHVRDDPVMVDALRPMFAHRTIARAILMPNLQPPVVNVKMAREYRTRVMTAIQQIDKEQREANPNAQPIQFQPLMTLYLTDATTEQDIREAKESGIVYACKLYPKGATTHSNQGVTDVLALIPVLKAMSDVGLLLLIHGESTDLHVDIFDRESSFLPVLKKILEAVPSLRIVLEHVTTAAAVEFVKVNSNGRLAATITAHHLLYARSALFEGGLQPHLYCLPVLKTESDRQALLGAVFDDLHRHLFFAGTDSAPHPRSNKERSGCAAGCFTAFATVELYVEALVTAGERAGIESNKVVRVIQDFLTTNGARFYQLQLNQPRTIRLVRTPFIVPDTMVSWSHSEVIELCLCELASRLNGQLNSRFLVENSDYGNKAQ